MNATATNDPGIIVVLAGAAILASVAAALVVVRRIGRGLPPVEWRPHPDVSWDGRDVAAITAMYLLIVLAASTMLPDKAPLGDLLVVDMIAKLAAVVAGIVHLVSRGADRRMLGFPPPRGDDVGLALGGLALVVAPLLSLAGLLDRLVPYEHPVVDFLRQQRGLLAVGLVVLSAVVVAPLAEEFFFRRVLQGWLERRCGGRAEPAVLLSAGMFAVAHAGHGLAVVPLFLLGIVLGTIARQTGSLVPCILLHGLFNAVSIALVLGGSGPAPLTEG